MIVTLPCSEHGPHGVQAVFVTVWISDLQTGDFVKVSIKLPREFSFTSKLLSMACPNTIHAGPHGSLPCRLGRAQRPCPRVVMPPPCPIRGHLRNLWSIPTSSSRALVATQAGTGAPTGSDSRTLPSQTDAEVSADDAPQTSSARHIPAEASTIDYQEVSGGSSVAAAAVHSTVDVSPSLGMGWLNRRGRCST